MQEHILKSINFIMPAGIFYNCMIFFKIFIMYLKNVHLYFESMYIDKQEDVFLLMKKKGKSNNNKKEKLKIQKENKEEKEAR